MTANQFLNSVLRLFSETLGAMWGVGIFRLLLAFMVLAVVWALCRELISASKTGVK